MKLRLTFTLICMVSLVVTVHTILAARRLPDLPISSLGTFSDREPPSSGNYEASEHGRIEATMLPQPGDESAWRESSRYPSLKELTDGRRDSSSSWIPFEDAASPEPSQVEVLRSDEEECIVTITTHGMYKEQVKAEEKEFERLANPEYGFTNELGKPQLPAIRGLIEIPPGKNVSLAVTTLRSLELLNYTIYPVQEPIPESREGASENVFQFDQEFYSTDIYYPHSWASVSSPAKLRDHTVVQLSVYPIRFNPAINRLNVSISIKIRLEYHDKGEAHITTFNRLSSPIFEEICETTIWNYDSSKPEALESESVGYLVISNDTFYTSMNSFVEWKTANGFNVSSVKLSDIGVGTNDTDIYNYIYNAFHNWTTPPTYVLLVGDVEYLPTHYGLVHPSPYEGGRKTATDHYYACVSGSDYLPDLFVGRLSVKSVLELNNTLNKLISYNGFFNKHATLVSDSGYFEETSNWIYDFLSAEGYTVDKLYKSLGTATTSNIANALNDGRTIINYRGHGDPTGWATGSFYNSHVLGLNNEGKYPIVISCTCLTGEYDYVSDCFGETWIKTQEKGAVAFWGSSRVSYGGYNDELSKGIYKAIFNDRLYEFGPITAKAKLYMYNYYGDGFTTQLEYEMYNILTDPQLYTSPFPQHELVVHLDSPNFATPDDSILLNATVFNVGLSNETSVELFLTINDEIVNSTTIPELFANSSYTISYRWNPAKGIYSVTAYAPPVPDESYTWNNAQSADVLVFVKKKIIVVADDDGTFSIRGTSLPEFELALTSMGYDYVVWNESSMGNPPLDFLAKFKLAIWTCGDYWNWTVDTVDAATLESYLAQGGNILLEGEDIAYSHNASDFIVNVAHAIYQVDNTTAPGLTVTNPTHPVAKGLPSNFNWTTDPPYDDGVTPANTGLEVIQYSGTNWTAVTVFEGTTSKVVYYAFPLYCLDKPEQEALAINSVNWLLEPPRAFGWSEDEVVCDEPASELRPSMATDSNGHLYVAFERYNETSGLYDICVSKSMDNGDTWSLIHTISSAVGSNLRNPSIAIDVGDNNNIFVAFEREWTPTDHDIFVLRYVGGSWSTSPVANTIGNNDRYPSITSEYQYGTGDWQYISYEHVYSYDDRDLWFAKSEDDGASWALKKLHGGWPDYNVHCQTSITTTRGSDGNDYIYIAYKWGADYATAHDIVIDKSKDWGNTWTQQWVCDESSRDKNWPSITATHGGGAVVIAWHVYWDATYLNDIQYAYSTNNGDSWNVGWLALEAGVNEETPTLTVDGQNSTSPYVYGNVHVAYWRESHIYYQQASYSSPWSWTLAEAVTDAAANVSAVYTKPAITTYRSPGGRYLPAFAWTDLRNGNYDIYYSTEVPIYTIYITVDGSVDPPVAPISSIDNITYTFTDDVYYSLVVERDNIVIDGSGYTLQGTTTSQSEGIRFWSRNVTIRNITIKAFAIGILFCHTDNTISETHITNNEIGIRILPPTGPNYIFRNNIANNGIGIWLEGCVDIVIYHNNFIDNAVQANVTAGYVNIWDDSHPSGGNYWSDYTDVDLYSGPYQNETGSDGIWDHPYVIDGNNQDNYPLRSPYEYWSNPILGDVNKDMKVDYEDLSRLVSAFGSTPEKPSWNPLCDFNGDHKVDASDLFELSRNFGETTPEVSFGTLAASASMIMVLVAYVAVPMRARSGYDLEGDFLCISYPS